MGPPERAGEELFELALDLLCVADTDGYFLKLNPAWERTLGWSRETLRSKPYIEFVHPDDRDETREAMARLAEGEDVRRFENRYRTEDGGYRWLRWNARADHEADRVYAAARDVTDGKRARQRLAQMAAVVGSSRDAIVSVDRDGTVQVWNPGAEELFDVPTEDAVGRPVDEALRAVDGLDLGATFDSLRVGDAIEDAEAQFVDPDDDVRTVSVTAFPVEGEGGVVGYSAICRDVTDRHRREEELRFQTALLESTYDAMADGVLVVDPDGEILVYNARFKEMWDLPSDVLATRSDEEAIGAVLDRVEDPDAFVDNIEHLYDHPYEESRDEIHLEDGRVFDRYSAPVVDEADELYGRVWFFRDITERKDKERELFEIAGELKRSNRALERFAYVASHDLREPLRMVRGSVEELVEDHADALDGEARELTRFARQGVERMGTLIDDLLAYSRVDTAAGEMEVVDPEAVAQEVLDDLAVAVEEAGADVAVEPMPHVVADRTQLRQVLQNLVSNALKFHEASPPTVRIDGERRGDMVEIRVADDGVGIPSGDQDAIFDVFRSVGRSGAEGSGIGLAICRRIVRRHGGEIDVESTPGEGSTFRVSLPAAEGSHG